MVAKVSVCIPTYNRKRYLQETLESIRAQTYRDYEIVIVDDGSTDGTEEMIRRLEYPVRYHWQENAGDAAARNALIELAEAEFITFIDSDDMLMPDTLQRLIAASQDAEDDVIVYGAYYGIDENSNVFMRCKRKLYSGFITKFLFQDILIHSCGSMFPAHVLKNYRFDTSLRVCSDYDLWLRLSLKYRFIALQEPTFKRRRHGGNLSTASFANRVAELEVLRNFYENKGGRDVIPRRIAMRRLSEEAYRAGKWGIAAGDRELGQLYLKKSLRYWPNIKALLRMGLGAIIRS